MKTLFVYLVLAAPFTNANAATLTRHRDVMSACQLALGDPALDLPYRLLQNAMPTATLSARAVKLLEEYSRQNPTSAEFVDVLMAGQQSEHDWDAFWAPAQRYALAARHLLHPGNEALAARHVELLWSHLLNVIGPDPVEMTGEARAEAQRVVTFIDKLAREHGETLARAWNENIWTSHGAMMREAWSVNRWERLLIDAASKYEPDSFSVERANYLRLLVAVIEAPLDPEAAFDFNFETLPTWSARVPVTQLDYDMDHVFGEFSTARASGGPRYLALVHRLSRLIENALPTGISIAGYTRVSGALTRWSRTDHLAELASAPPRDSTIQIPRDGDFTYLKNLIEKLGTERLRQTLSSATRAASARAWSLELAAQFLLEQTELRDEITRMFGLGDARAIDANVIARLLARAYPPL